MSRRSKLRAWVVALVAALAVLVGGIGVAFANAGDTPAHQKTRTANGDGTYKLELTVTGDAETEVETAANVNVLIIYDESSSMTSNNVTTNPNRNRGNYAEDVMHDFIVNLQGYQSTSDPSNIEMALVGFGPNATTRQAWTSNLGSGNNGINRFFDDGVDGTVTSTHDYTRNNGTNWQAAMSQAQTLLNDPNLDDDPTFVILVTDGAPTAASGQSTIAPSSTRPWTDYRVYYNAATQGAFDIQSRENTTLFGIYAYGTEADLLDDLIYYSNTGSHRVVDGYSIATATAQQHNFGATEGADNYFNASDTEALNAAIESIFQTIVEALGVSQVAISDGTTHEVATSSGPIELLEVDESSYQYWLKIPISNNNTFQRVDLVTGETVTYTVSSNGSAVTWGSNSVTVNGEIVSEGGQRYLKYEWTGANALYNFNPPVAQLNGSSVDWNLAPVGTLLDGVTYSVTFDVYPSQETYDMIAELKNGDLTYSEIDENVRQYLIDQGDDNYALETNTTATLSWTDTRPDGGSGSTTYENPPAVATTAEDMSVHKEWENALDGHAVGSIDMTVLMSNSAGEFEEFTDVTLSENTNPRWTKGPIYISTGLMRTKVDENGEEYMQILDTGHDFKFAELGSEQFNWELVTPVMHPMIIDGTLTMLIMVDADHPKPADTQTYELNGKTYYVAREGEAALEAYNYRRSNLNLMKVVDGEDADPNQTFPFTLTVNNKKASSGSADDTNSDYYVWFAIDSDPGEGFSPVTDSNLVSGEGVVQSGDYWYAPSGTRITVEMKADWNLRFTNLPTGTTYTFAEGDLADGFAFNKSELTGQYGSEAPKSGTAADSSWTAGQTSSGTIQSTNTTYQVTFTNDYELTDLKITKQWVDASNQDGIRPTAAEFAELLTLSPAVDGATPTVVDNGDDTYTITYTGLPRFTNGEEVTYTVTEAEIDNYTTEGSPAEDHGTITNTHEPEVIDISANKVWDDNNDQDGIRPDSVTFNLLADGVVVDGKAVTLDGTVDEAGEAAAWVASWTGLPRYKDGGTEIVYTVDEVTDSVITGTDAEGTYAYEVVDNEDGTFTVTNTHTPEVIEIVGEKTWDDPKYFDESGEPIGDYERPNIALTLTGKAGDTEVVSVEVTLDGTADTAPTGTDPAGYEYEAWKYKFVNLPKYNDGTEVAYTLAETTPDGFTSEVTGYDVVNTPEETKKVNKAEITVKKTDENTGTGLAGAVFTLTDSEGNKTTYTTGSDGTVTITFDGYTTDEDVEVAKTSTYTLAETTPPTGYESADPASWSITVDEELQSVTKVEEEGKTLWQWLYDLITGSDAEGWDAENNTLTVENPPTETTVTVDKVWDDSDDQDGKRPETLSYTLTDGVDYEDTKVVTVADDGSASYTWTGLVAYRDGKAVSYTVSEATVDGYTTTDSGISGDAEGGYEITFTNSYTPEQTSVSVEKVWEDMDDINEMRPDSVDVQLLADGEASGDPKTLDESSEWKATWTNLPKYKDGTEIAYTVEENPVPTGYTVSYAVDEGAYIITNTLDLTGPVSASKAWLTVDSDGVESTAAPDGAEVTFTLYADGEATGYSVVLDGTADEAAPTVTGGWESAEWVATFVNLPKTNDETDKDIVYTVAETGTFKDYACSGSPAEDGGTITNTHRDSVKDVVPSESEISVDGALVSAGDTLTYTITYANNRSDKATVTVTDEIPDNTTIGEVRDGGVYDESTRTITWVIEDVAAGATGTVSFDVTVNDGSNGETIENEATVNDGENESNTNVVTTSVPVKDVTKADEETGEKESVDGEGVQVGDTLTYDVTFTITKAADSVIVTDEVPEHTSLVDGTITDGGVYDESTRTITWNLGPREADTYTVSFDVTVDETAVQVDGITNTAYINVNDNPKVETNEVEVEPEKGNLAISKTVTVPDGFKIDENKAFNFTITLTDKNGNPLAESYAYTGSYEGTVSGEGSFSLKHGESITISGLPAGAKYAISETAESGYAATAKNGEGTIVSDDTVTAEFVNAYSAKPVSISFPVQKIVTVPEGMTEPDWSFDIDVTANEGAPEASSMSATVSKGADTVTFGDFTFTKPGIYTYTVTESGSVTGVTNDAEAETGKTVTVTVVDNRDGTMAATADSTDEEPVNFVNPYEPEVGLEVTKTVTSKPANGSYYKAGETVTYKVVVTNTGEYDLADVKVDDELTGDHWTIATLAAGASESFDVSYKVTDADVKAGSVLNVVTAEAENPYDPDEPLKDKDDVEVPTGSDQTPPKPNPPKKKVIPQTGDETPTGAMALMTVFGTAALTAGTVLKRKRK